MAQPAVDFRVPFSVGACATRLRQRAIQLSKQREQQRRDKEWYTLEVISEGKDTYRVRLSKSFGGIIGTKLDAHLQKDVKNQTRVSGTTHIDRFTKGWTTFVGGLVIFYLLIGVEGMLSSRWFAFGLVGFALALGPLYAAHRMKKDLINLFHDWLEPTAEGDSSP